MFTPFLGLFCIATRVSSRNLVFGGRGGGGGAQRKVEMIIIQFSISAISLEMTEMSHALGATISSCCYTLGGKLKLQAGKLKLQEGGKLRGFGGRKASPLR